MLKDVIRTNWLKSQKVNPEQVPENHRQKDESAQKVKAESARNLNPEWTPENLVVKEKVDKILSTKLNKGGLMGNTTLKGMMNMKVGQIPV